MSNKQRLPEFPRTDAGNAELFASLYGERVRFDHKQSRWLIWNETRSRWEEDKQCNVRILAKLAARHRAETAWSIPNEDERKREGMWALQSEGRYRIDAAIGLARSEPPLSDLGEGWDADPWLFGVENGIVDLRTGSLRPVTQNDRMTKFSPVAFDATANCPRFERFLNEIFDGDSEMIGFLQKAIGYSLTGHTREQCLFACYGEGSNGKSTLLGIFQYIFGDGQYAVNLPFSVLEMAGRSGIPNDVMTLYGARFTTAIETREDIALNEARIKMLTGGDRITARRLYHDFVTFLPTHKLWLAFNHRPKIMDDSNAMWRRIRLIQFLHTFDSQDADKELPEKLKAEAPAILNWAIAGCLAWQREGLRTPAAVTQATDKYEAESDPLTPFFEDCCELDAAFRVAKTELRNAYQDWCRANREKPLSRKAFPEKLKKRCFSEGSTGSVRFWKGIRLRVTYRTDAIRAALPKLPIEQPRMESFEKQGQIVSVASGEPNK